MSFDPLPPGCLALVVRRSPRTCPSFRLPPPRLRPPAETYIGRVVTVIGPARCGCSCCVTIDPGDWKGAKLPKLHRSCLLRIDPDDQQRDEWLRQEEQRRLRNRAREMPR